MFRQPSHHLQVANIKNHKHWLHPATVWFHFHPEDGNLFAETYVGMTIYAYKQVCAFVGLILKTDNTYGT
jgi:hypothetical protein